MTRKIETVGLRFSAAGLALAAMSGMAAAHPGHGASGFDAGLLHPFSGLDHKIAMTAVGFCAARLGGRAVWALPLAFMAVMTLGFVWAMLGQPLGLVEEAILASMFVLPAMAVIARKVNLAPAVLVTAGFALFHGFAHGMELPVNATSWTYAGGFVLATAMLHGLGLAAGLLSDTFAQMLKIGWVTRTRT